MNILQKIGNSSELPGLICLAISTGSATSETQNTENHKMNRHTNISCKFLPYFYEIFSNNICLKLVLKSKLSPHSDSVALKQLNPIYEKGL